MVNLSCGGFGPVIGDTFPSSSRKARLLKKSKQCAYNANTEKSLRI
jgi:hypothetical protein